MCIQSSVGRLGLNKSTDDIKTIQVLLNLNTDMTKLVPFRLVEENGKLDGYLFEAIDAFQRRTAGLNANGLVEPNGPTLKALRGGMPGEFVPGKLQGIMIKANSQLIDAYFAPLVGLMAQHDINTPLRMAHFFGQIGHESGMLRYTTEFASGAAYEGRAGLGNTQQGDGVRFKGRGLIQITGRANYEAFGKSRGIDYTQDPNRLLMASDPTTAGAVSCWFWSRRKLNALADADDLIGISKRVNGGANGLSERGAIVNRAKFFLGVN